MKLTAVIALLLGQFTAGAALVWEPAVQTQVVFAGRPSVIRQDIRNEGEQAVLQPVRLHLHQLTANTAAPVTGWELKKQVEVPAGQTLRTSVDVSLPKVTSPTRFLVTWSNETGSRLGSTEVIGCPQDLLHPLRAAAARQPLGLLGEATGMTGLLRQQGCPVRELRTAEDLKSFEGPVVLVAWPVRPKEEQEHFGRIAAQHAKDRGGRIVWLVEPDNLSLAPAPAVCVFSHGQGTIVVCVGMKLAELSQSPLNQLRLVWLVELALASEENRLLLLGRLLNL